MAPARTRRADLCVDGRYVIGTGVSSLGGTATRSGSAKRSFGQKASTCTASARRFGLGGRLHASFYANRKIARLHIALFYPGPWEPFAASCVRDEPGRPTECREDAVRRRSRRFKFISHDQASKWRASEKANELQVLFANGLYVI